MRYLRYVFHFHFSFSQHPLVSMLPAGARSSVLSLFSFLFDDTVFSPIVIPFALVVVAAYYYNIIFLAPENSLFYIYL